MNSKQKKFKNRARKPFYATQLMSEIGQKLNRDCLQHTCKLAMTEETFAIMNKIGSTSSQAATVKKCSTTDHLQTDSHHLQRTFYWHSGLLVKAHL